MEVPIFGYQKKPGDESFQLKLNVEVVECGIVDLSKRAMVAGLK